MASLALDMAKFVGYKYLTNLINSNGYENTKIKNDPDGVISRLKIIGKIEQGYQFDVTTYKMQPDNYWTKFERTVWRPDCRGNTVTFIKNAINDGYMLLAYKLSLNSDTEIVSCQKILNDIFDCKKGIHNLCKHPRYKNDIGFISEMETILDKIDNVMTEVKNTYPHIQVKSNTTNNTPCHSNINTPPISPRSRSMSIA